MAVWLDTALAVGCGPAFVSVGPVLGCYCTQPESITGHGAASMGRCCGAEHHKV